MNFLAVIGRIVFSFLDAAGRIGIFAVTAFSHMLTPPYYPRELFKQMMNIGYYSLPVVGLTTLFTGAALAVNISEGSSRFNAESTLPIIVVIGIVRELGPTLCGLIVAGREHCCYWHCSRAWPHIMRVNCCRARQCGYGRRTWHYEGYRAN